jgi:hypothetical protein
MLAWSTRRGLIGAAMLILAVGALLMIVAQTHATGDLPGPAASAPAAAPFGNPAFSGLDGARAKVSSVAQAGLDQIGVDPSADTSVVPLADGVTATIARTADHYYLLVEKDQQLRAMVDTPIANLVRFAGTYVVAGTGTTSTAVIVVPDGVSSVTITDDAGASSQIPVTDNVAETTRDGRFAASFDYNGKPVEVFPLPPVSPAK